MLSEHGPFTDFKYKLIYYANTTVIKGSYSIKNYDDTMVILKCENDILTVKGESIEINSLDADAIYISGKISDICFS